MEGQFKNQEQQTAEEDVKVPLNSSLSDPQLHKSEPGGKVISFIKQHEGDESTGEGADPEWTGRIKMPV